MWSPGSRAAAFLLGFSSIAALIAHFYGLASMHVFVPAITLPCFLAVALWWIVSRFGGRRSVAVALGAGILAGVVAAVAYDAFRLPFVMLQAAGVKSSVSLPLFKVFVRFGAMILGQPVEQAHYSWTAHLLGWIYHFSNAVGFGLMYVALVGHPLRRHWAWAVVLALALEAGMLLMPYAQTFSIKVTTPFVVITLAAHAVFGIVLGLAARVWFLRNAVPPPAGLLAQSPSMSPSIDDTPISR